MKKLFLALAFLFCACPALADSLVVTTCGTLPKAYSAGATRYDTVDVNGNKCVLPSAATAPLNTIGITPTDRTVTSATGASQTLMSANASRHSMTITNTGNANCGVNPTGGTAAIGGAGTITLTPQGAYTPRIPTLSAVTVICTAGQPIYGDEN